MVEGTVVFEVTNKTDEKIPLATLNAAYDNNNICIE